MKEDALSETKDAETSWVLSGNKSYKKCGDAVEVGSNDNVLKIAFKTSEDDGK
jgi:hypothetical protein